MNAEKSTLPSIPEKQLELAKKLNDRVFAVIGKDALQGFEKAYHIANAIGDLKTLLTPEYMKPIMALQGNKLGFKTDKDDKGGYPEEVVKNCLIEAVLTGLEPWGNQFNIISGQMYGTKEGFGALLNKTKGLKYDITPSLPRINAAKDGAAVNITITWTYGSEPENKKDIDFPIKMNQYMGADAVIGKATRKARAWLFNKINGTEIGEADVQDIDHKIVPSKDTEITFEELNTLLEAKMDFLSKSEFDQAKRILDTKEVASYKKLLSLLNSK